MKRARESRLKPKEPPFVSKGSSDTDSEQANLGTTRIARCRVRGDAETGLPAIKTLIVCI